MLYVSSRDFYNLRPFTGFNIPTVVLQTDSQTLVSVLTPAGRGAVAVILLQSGDSAERSAAQLADLYFQSAGGKPLTAAKAGSIRFGRWQAEASHAGEEVVVVCKSQSHLEIHCHGGQVAVEQIVDCLMQVGAERMRWQDLSAKLPLATDQLQAQAAALLPFATTEKTAAILLDQTRGALSAELAKLEERLVNKDPAAKPMLEELLATSRAGQRLTKPFQLVIAGVPNVGKSSLTNAIVGYQRAIVADLPGTTRDVLTADTVIDGWPVQIRDTAGIRASDDQIEAGGVQLAHQTIAAADLVIELIDATRPTERAELTLPANSLHLKVWNKIDAAARADLQKLYPNLNADSLGEMAVSAKTGGGLTELIERLGELLGSGWRGYGTAVLFTPAQQSAVERILERLEVPGNWFETGFLQRDLFS